MYRPQQEEKSQQFFPRRWQVSEQQSTVPTNKSNQGGKLAEVPEQQPGLDLEEEIPVEEVPVEEVPKEEQERQSIFEQAKQSVSATPAYSGTIYYDCQ